MLRAERKDFIEKLQAARGNRLLIAYVTSTRPNHEIQIADDAFRLVYDHLEAGRELAQNGVDLFIHSNGGSGTVPCGFGQNANMVGLPEYGVILTGDIESPTPTIVDGNHKYLLGYVLRLTHANGGSMATPKLLTRNFRLNLPINSTTEMPSTVSTKVNGVVVSGPGAGPVVKAILESVIFDDGQFVGTDSRYFDNMSIQIDAERLLAQHVATHPPIFGQS